VKILMAGDTHGDGSHVRYLLQVAQREGCDRIFVLGDFGYWEHMNEGINFLDRANLNANLKNIPIYFLDGNHDKTSLLLEKYGWTAETGDGEGFLMVRPYVRYSPRGHQWEWGGKQFISLGGAYSVDKESRLEREAKTGKPESLWFPEEEMTNEEMEEILDRAAPETVDVMLAHDKPRSSTPGWNRKEFVECFANQERLERAIEVLRPSYYFHGHLHYRYTEVRFNEEGKQRFRLEGLDCNTQDQTSFLLNDAAAPQQSWYVFDTENPEVSEVSASFEIALPPGMELS